MSENLTNDTQRIALESIVQSARYSIVDEQFKAQCKSRLDEHGVLVLPEFLTDAAVQSIVTEGVNHKCEAFYTVSDHNVYLKPKDDEFDDSHIRNRMVSSSKGCITTDQIPPASALHTLYENADFKNFLCHVLDEESLHEYADPLSSINLHYAAEGQELGWHFDNSSFAITLLVQKPESGGVFEFVKDVRDADAGEMNFDATESIVNGNEQVSTLDMDAGCLVLFRGRNSLHRVTPTEGDVTRMLVVLAYNSEAGVSLSESARMTFYGRLN